MIVTEDGVRRGGAALVQAQLTAWNQLERLSQRPAMKSKAGLEIGHLAQFPKMTAHGGLVRKADSISGEDGRAQGDALASCQI